MEQGFIDAIQKMVKDYGKDTLLETRKAKAMLGDFTQNNFPKETNLLKQLLDANCANIINEARNVAEVKTALVKRLEDDHSISTNKSTEMLDLLGLVLRGDNSKTETTSAEKPTADTAPKPVKAQTYTTSDEMSEAQIKAQTEAREKAQAEAEAKTGNDYLIVYGDLIAENYDKALPGIQALAHAGHARAQHDLGRCYRYGYGVAEDYAEAVEWYRKGAEQGDPHAQLYLGRCYHYGEGVAKDYAKALEWYRKAVAQGNETAKKELDKLKAEDKI